MVKDVFISVSVGEVPNRAGRSTGEKTPRYTYGTLTFTQATTVENGWPVV